MKLADVRKHTGRQLAPEEAAQLVGGSDTVLKNQALALSMHTWNNTADDWLRLEAALVILHHGQRRARR